MQGRGVGRWLRALLLVAVLAIGAAGVPNILTGSHDVTSVALAGVANGKNDKKKNDNDKGKNVGNDKDADHVLRGQVLTIDTNANPPEMMMADRDGRLVVKVIKTDEIAKSGVQPGDHVHLDGEKIHEYLFEATQIEVTDKCCGPPDNDNR